LWLVPDIFPRLIIFKNYTFYKLNKMCLFIHLLFFLS
jgi:hypothetical protein